MQIFTYEEMNPSEKTLNFIKQFAHTYQATPRQTNYGLN